MGRRDSGRVSPLVGEELENGFSEFFSGGTPTFSGFAFPTSSLESIQTHEKAPPTHPKRKTMKLLVFPFCVVSRHVLVQGFRG